MDCTGGDLKYHTFWLESQPKVPTLTVAHTSSSSSSRSSSSNSSSSSGCSYVQAFSLICVIDSRRRSFAMAARNRPVWKASVFQKTTDSVCPGDERTGDEEKIIVLDSGGGHLRAGPANGSAPAAVEPNCSAVPKVRGERQLAFGCDVHDLPAYRLHRPTQRGLLLDPEQQKMIWKAALLRDNSLMLGGLKTCDCSILVIQSSLTPRQLQQEAVDILVQDLRFAKAVSTAGPALALHSPGLKQKLAGRRVCTVLDLGFSACFAQPCVDGSAIVAAGKRLDVGGRVLTNLLLERLGLCHLDLSNAWLLAEDALAKTGQVTRDFNQVLRREYSNVESMRYVLPDFEKYSRGFVASKDFQSADLQSVNLVAERVAIPEALFRPQDHGLALAGLPNLLQEAIMAVEEEDLRPNLACVALCGGLARLPGLADRLRLELRQLMPSHWDVDIVVEEEPELSLWRGAAEFARTCPNLRVPQATSNRGRDLVPVVRPRKLNKYTAGHQKRKACELD